MLFKCDYCEKKLDDVEEVIHVQLINSDNENNFCSNECFKSWVDDLKEAN